VRRRRWAEGGLAVRSRVRSSRWLLLDGSSQCARIPPKLPGHDPAVAMIARRLDTPAVDIPSFLRTYPPFDELTDDRLSTVVEHTHIEFYGRDQIILQAGGDPAQYLYVVRTGAVELVDEEQVLDLLSEGEVFGHPSLL